jgi:hypothetical protein
VKVVVTIFLKMRWKETNYEERGEWNLSGRRAKGYDYAGEQFRQEC